MVEVYDCFGDKYDLGDVAFHFLQPSPDRMFLSILDVVEPLCATGFLRQVTQLCLTSKAVAASLPMGTGAQICDAAANGLEDNLRVYLEYWRGNNDSQNVLNWSPPYQGWVTSPLFGAVGNDQLGSVKLLLSLAPPLDVNRGLHLAPLHWASYRGHEEMVRLLLAAPDIDVNIRTTQGRVPLMEAAEAGNDQVVRMLVAVKGIELEAYFLFWQTVEAPTRECYNDPFNYYDVGTPTTALDLATQGNHYEVVAILTEAIERKRALDALGRPVYNAAFAGNVDVLRPLIDNLRGKAHAPDALNWTPSKWSNSSPLGTAAGFGFLEVVQLLAKTPGVDVNQVDGYGWSALMDAANRGHAHVVRFLLTVEGVDIHQRATSGLCKGLTALGVTARGEWSYERSLVQREIADMLRAKLKAN